jgi:hypothetical protein
MGGLAASAGALLKTSLGRADLPTQKTVEKKTAAPSLTAMGTVVEPARTVPVVADTEVLVIGGGPAGVAAAIAAARAGADTILVERYNHLGGLWTGGLVLPLLSTHAMDQQGVYKKILGGVGDEMALRLTEMGMAIREDDPVVDPEATKYLLDVMTRDSGVKVMYHCWAANLITEGDTIKTVFLESKSGRVAVTCKVVVDGTGDGDILHLAGEDYDFMNYHIGLVHRLGNIDTIDETKPGYRKLNVGNPTPIQGVHWVNMHGDTDQNGIDLETLSSLQQKYRIQIWERLQKIRAVPGYEAVYLLDTASQIGVRMSRILKGRYCLTLKDSMTYRTFDDVIGISGSWTTMLYDGQRVSPRKRPLWQIPYRSLVPLKTRNLLAAGRCFSFEKALVEDTRVIGTCLVTGHAAGAAAAVAVQQGTSCQAVDLGRVQKLLRSQKANLG